MLGGESLDVATHDVPTRELAAATRSHGRGLPSEVAAASVSSALGSATLRGRGSHTLALRWAPLSLAHAVPDSDWSMIRRVCADRESDSVLLVLVRCAGDSCTCYPKLEARR